MRGPTLVVMAAGMGSRFGGNKQMTPIDDLGHVITDYSAYDALQTGFEKIVFIIKHSFEKDFRERIGDAIAGSIDVDYAFQEQDMLPEGFSVPEDRVKPWGTAHAVLCAADRIKGPFAAINADDFYGREAFRSAAEYLKADHGPSEHAMVGYLVEKTLTENGSVSRGVCETDRDGYLTSITERTAITPCQGGAVYTDQSGEKVFLPQGTIVSMNLWCFMPSVLDAIREGFADFLRERLPVDPLKCEYYLPSVPDRLIGRKEATVKVLGTSEQWYGMTYREDLEKVRSAVRRMQAEGLYPERLWR